MSSPIGPISTIFSRYQFVITPQVGVWLFSLVAYPNVSVAFSNCSLPESYEFVGKSTWKGFEIIWALCDWNTSFGLVTPPFPDFVAIINLLTGPTRIPGPCSGGGSGSGVNIYNTSDSLTGNRLVNLNNHDLSFNVQNAEYFKVDEAINNLDLLKLKSDESLLQNKVLVYIRSDDGKIQLNSKDIELQVLGGTLKALGLTQTTKPMVLFYDPFTNEITYDFTSVNNIYSNNGTISSDREVNLDDKKLTFITDLPNSRFLVSRSSTFPPVSGSAAALFVEPNDFASSGKPAAGMGYVTDAVINDSASFLASEVTGQKSAMMIATNNTLSVNNFVNVSNNGVQILANVGVDSSQITVEPTQVIIDGGTSQNVKVQNIGVDSTYTNILRYDNGTGDVKYGKPINFYNNNGTLDCTATGGVRTVNLDDQILLFQGNGNDYFQIDNIQELDVTTTNNISIQTPQLIIVPQFPLDNTVDDIIVQDSSSGQIKRRTANTIIPPMQPTVLGTTYGNQSSATDNHIGFENQVGSGSRSNVIAAYISNSVSADESNLMISYQNFQSSSGTHSHSNLIISGDSSDLTSSNRTHVYGHELQGNGINLDNSIYIGNLRNVKPADVSVCLTNDLVNNTIEMAKESVYIGSNANSIVLGNNEFHIDFKCPRWFYHDLASGTTSEQLYYDSANSQITFGPLPPAPTPNTTLSNLGAGNVILATPGTLPATTTRSFKSIVAGANVFITNDANTVTIGATMPENAIFSVGLDPFNITGPFPAPFAQVPNSFGSPLSTLTPTNHPGYNNAGAALDLNLGNYTVPTTNQYRIHLQVTVRNTTEVCNFSIAFRDILAGTDISTAAYNSGVINSFSTFTFDDYVTLTQPRLYKFVMYLNNGAATTYNFNRLIYSINVV